jgi:ribonuclease III
VATTPDARPSKRSSSSDRPLASLGVPEQLSGIYELALTHRSFAFEQPDATPHNERLEFLGDAVVGIVVTDMIYARYPELTEGEMARLRASVVNTNALANVARAHDVGLHLRLGKGEEGSGGRNKDSLLADTFEAVVGAVYLDRGLDAVREHLGPIFEDLITRSAGTSERYDAKTALQEVGVRRTSELPLYRVASSGPDHDRHYTAHVYVAEELWGSGSGKSKKEAEQNAAREALRAFAEEDDDA